MAFVDNKINALSGKDRENFEKTLSAILNDNMWFSLRGFSKNDINLAVTVLYDEMFEDDFSYLRGTYFN